MFYHDYEILHFEHRSPLTVSAARRALRPQRNWSIDHLHRAPARRDPGTVARRRLALSAAEHVAAARAPLRPFPRLHHRHRNQSHIHRHPSYIRHHRHQRLHLLGPEVDRGNIHFRRYLRPDDRRCAVVLPLPLFLHDSTGL
jgi:hypothetical protein